MENELKVDDLCLVIANRMPWYKAKDLVKIKFDKNQDTTFLIYNFQTKNDCFISKYNLIKLPNIFKVLY